MASVLRTMERSIRRASRARHLLDAALQYRMLLWVEAKESKKPLPDRSRRIARKASLS